MENYNDELLRLQREESWLQDQISKFERLMQLDPYYVNYPLERQYYLDELEAVRSQISSIR